MGGVAWKIRAVMLLQVAAAALAAWLANAVLGGDVNAWLATFGVLAVFTALLGVLLEKSLVGRLNALRAVIAGMYGDGDLTRRAAVEGRDEIAGVAEDFNRLIGSFATIVGKVLFNSVEVVSASKQLMGDANRVASGSNQQRDAALATTGAMGELTENMSQVSRSASETAEISETSSRLSSEGMRIVHLSLIHI